VENSEATWKKATKCNKHELLFYIEASFNNPKGVLGLF
jgi:hypothetical protein